MNQDIWDEKDTRDEIILFILRILFILIPTTMLKNYLKIAYRNFIRNKVYSLINTLGLALSMFCAMLIILWISDELSYEAFWPNSDRLYRLVQAPQFDDGTVFKAASNPAPMPEYIKEQYPGIVEFTRFRPLPDKVLMQYNDANFYEDVTYVDSTFFKVFQWPFLAGNPNNALFDPNSMVITERMAEKYFGVNWQQEGVLGKTVSLNKNENYAVSGVIRICLPIHTFSLIYYFLSVNFINMDGIWIGIITITTPIFC